MITTSTGFVTASAVRGEASFVEVNWLDRELPDPNDQREYARERCIVAITEALGEAIENAGLTNAQLARLLNVTAPRVNHILSDRNLTLKTVADVLWACKLEVNGIQSERLGVSRMPIHECGEYLSHTVDFQLDDATEKQERPAANNALALAS
jgi:predicted XRE-type DNA-binding protein